MTGTGWEELADWYDAKQGDTGDLWHRHLIDPVLLGLLGPVGGLRLLDLGCGNGYLARRFAREGALVTALDASPRLVEHARARERTEPLGITYQVADAQATAELPTARFDRVVSNMVLMNVGPAAEAIGEVGRLLRPGGRFVFSISHPCFDLMSRSEWTVAERGGRTEVGRRIFGYRTPFADDVPWKVAPDRTASTRGYHRPLSFYFAALRSAGLLVEDLVEPSPSPELLAADPPSSYLAEIPLQCVLSARRVGP